MERFDLIDKPGMTGPCPDSADSNELGRAELKLGQVSVRSHLGVPSRS